MCIAAPERFEAFIAACEMDARGRLGLEQRAYPQADYLRGAAAAARAVAVQPLVQQGLTGQALGDALKSEATEGAEGLQGRGRTLARLISLGGVCIAAKGVLTRQLLTTPLERYRCQHLFDMRIGP